MKWKRAIGMQCGIVRAPLGVDMFASMGEEGQRVVRKVFRLRIEQPRSEPRGETPLQRNKDALSTTMPNVISQPLLHKHEDQHQHHSTTPIPSYHHHLYHHAPGVCVWCCAMACACGGEWWCAYELKRLTGRHRVKLSNKAPGNHNAQAWSFTRD